MEKDKTTHADFANLADIEAERRNAFRPSAEEAEMSAQASSVHANPTSDEISEFQRTAQDLEFEFELWKLFYNSALCNILKSGGAGIPVYRSAKGFCASPVGYRLFERLSEDELNLFTDRVRRVPISIPRGR